jgi:SAM-dependent methyltransferase
MKLDDATTKFLACPKCKTALSDLSCPACAIEFPVADSVPVLINEANSIFRIEDVLNDRETTYRQNSAAKNLVKSLIPSISINVKAKANFRTFFSRFAHLENAVVLVVGGAVTGSGLGDIPPNITLVETDAACGPQTTAICDAHDLPFLDRSFDGVIAQAVLEHVIDPARCVAEIHRVLKPDGVVYAETPFMQQVHAGRYDFTRFTHLGHRYLFREFDEIASGPCSGPGTALAWSYCYFLQSFFSNRTLGQAAFAFGSITGFWLKYFDHFLSDKPGSFDAASAYYFLGSKSETSLSATKLIGGYRGQI